MHNQTCQQCRFCVVGDINLGTLKSDLRCCYEPPKALPVMTQQGPTILTYFPVVQEGWGCGKFDPTEH